MGKLAKDMGVAVSAGALVLLLTYITDLMNAPARIVVCLLVALIAFWVAHRWMGHKDRPATRAHVGNDLSSRGAVEVSDIKSNADQVDIANRIDSDGDVSIRGITVKGSDE